MRAVVSTFVAFAGLSLFSCLARGESNAGDAQKCRLADEADLIKTVPLSVEPNYFIRAFTNSRRIGLIADDGNRVLDVDSGRLEKIEGDIDVVPLQGSDTVVLPLTQIYDHKAKSFREDVSTLLGPTTTYVLRNGTIEVLKSKVGSRSFYEPDPKLKLSDLLASGKDVSRMGLAFISSTEKVDGRSKEVYFDTTMQGNYQSTGVLRKDGQATTHRVLLQENQDGLSIRDYRSTKSSDGKETFAPIGKKRVICKGTQLSLPMLSKDGREISAYDNKSQTTTIFAIDESTGKCVPKETFPYMTGKMDFNSDGSKVVFHIEQNNTSQKFFKTPRGPLSAYLYDRKAKRLIPLATSPDFNAYYPVFFDGDKIGYLRTGSDSEKGYAFEIVKPRPGIACSNCESGKPESARVILGRLWTGICSPALSVSDTVTMADLSQRIPRRNCETLVKEEWSQYKDALVGDNWLSNGVAQASLRKVGQSDLIEACRKNAGSEEQSGRAGEGQKGAN